ncbi:MAG: hypothetical protein ACI4XM_02325 [Candidatus Coprovivens sp.]
MKKNKNILISIYLIGIILVPLIIHAFPPIILIVTLIFIFSPIFAYFNEIHWTNGKYKNKYRILSDKSISDLGIENKEETIEELQDLLSKFLIEYTKVNIEELKKYSVELAFHNAKYHLENNEKPNSISNIKYLDSKIFEIQSTHDLIKIYILLKAEYNVINNKEKSKQTSTFECVFKADNKKEYFDNCPNCGAPLKKISNHECEFCKQKIYHKNWKLAELKEIKEDYKEIYEKEKES